MTRKVPLYAVFALIFAAIALTFCVTYAGMKYWGEAADAPIQQGELAVSEQSVEAFQKLAYIDELYRKYYVHEIDPSQLQAGLIQGYFAGVGDKYASYMDAENFKAYLAETNGSFVGIGVHVIYNAEYGSIEVISVMPDSPALAVGIEPGDLIYKVEDAFVSEIGYYPAIERVLGEVGTSVTISVRRGTKYEIDKTFTVTRAEIENTTVSYRMYQDTIGIVRIYSFTAHTDEAVIEAVQALQNAGAQKLIFDVRNNPGGELTGIVDTLDFLLPQGPIVHIVDGAGQEQKISTSDADCVTMPMAVLVNGGTASAAELFTSALQDYQCAVIVGTQTYGKGTVQSLITLPDGSGLTFSTSMYNPPFSENYEGKGITPDIEVSLSDEAASINIYKLPDNLDNQLQAAIDALNQ